MTFIVSLSSALLATIFYCGKIKLQKMTKSLRIYWFLYINVAPFAIFITIFYWSFLHKDQELSVNNFLTHGTNFIGPVLDLFIISHPYHLGHIIYPMICMALYVVYTFIFQFSGGVNPQGKNFIYFVCDWIGNLPLSIKTAFGTIISLGILHLFCCGLQFLRDKIYKGVENSKHPNEVSNEDPEICRSLRG